MKKESILFTLEQKSTNRSKLIYIRIEHTTEIDNNEITKYLKCSAVDMVEIVDWSDGHHVDVESKDLQIVVRHQRYKEEYKEEAEDEENNNVVVNPIRVKSPPTRPTIIIIKETSKVFVEESRTEKQDRTDAKEDDHEDRKDSRDEDVK